MIGGQLHKQGGAGGNEKTGLTGGEGNQQPQGGNGEGVHGEGGNQEGGDNNNNNNNHHPENVMMVQGMTLKKETYVPRDVRKLLSESSNPLFVLYEEFGHLIPELGLYHTPTHYYK